MINDLLKEYMQIRLFYELEGKDPSSRIETFLGNFVKELGNDWKEKISQITNNYIAMYVFYEIMVREMAGDMPGLICYYFSTIVVNDSSLSDEMRLEGYRFRAFTLIQNLEKWNNVLMFAQSSINYNGNMHDNSFVDMLLMSDIYKAWNSQPSNPMLERLKTKASSISKNYTNYTRQQIIIEGKRAHESLFKLIKGTVINK